MMSAHNERMNDMGARLKQLRTSVNMSQTELARATGIEQSTISRIESGDIELISPNAKKISAALGISLVGLLGVAHNVSPAPLGTRRLPVLDYNQAAKRARGQVGQEQSMKRFAVTDLSQSANSYALNIEGDSMEPVFDAGDLVVIDPDIPYQPGDYVVAVGTEGKATFGKYKATGVNDEGADTFEIVPLNPYYAPLRSGSLSLTIGGVMVEHRKFRRR